MRRSPRAPRRLAALALAVVIGCSMPRTPEPSSEPMSSAAPSRSSLPDDASGGVEGAHAQWAKLPFERLTFRGKGNYGTCPVYEVELRRDGTADWRGQFFTPRVGLYEGKLEFEDYARLCAAVEEQGLERMDASYATNSMHDETVEIQWYRDGVVGVVSDYGRGAPQAFQYLRALFEETAERIDWRPLAK